MRRNLVGLLVIVCGAVALAACTASAPTATGSPGLTSTAHATTTTTTSAPPGPPTPPTPGAAPCTANELRALGGGREGGGLQTAAGTVEIENIGSAPCVLDGSPSAISPVGTSGTAPALAITYQPATARTALTLHPGDVADADLNWANWCHRDPGPLRVRLTLPGGAGTVESPFDGPPNYDYVPGCIAPGRPSTVMFAGAPG